MQLLIIITCSQAQLWTGILNPARAIDWTSAGIVGGIPSRNKICATINASAYKNGAADATSGIQSAINSCPMDQVVQLSAGTFLINGNLNLKGNVVLRGAGADQTILNAMGSSSNGVIQMGVGAGPNFNYDPAANITSGNTSGSTSITVDNISGMSVGRYLVISQLNDGGIVTNIGTSGVCTWCDGGEGQTPFGGGNPGGRAQGQIVEITSLKGNVVGISPGLYTDYPLSPHATPFTSGKYVGVEDLQVYANNTGYSANFKMTACAYCWLSGVEGNYADHDHVEIDFGYRDEVVNSYFSNAYVHDSGQSDADVSLRGKTSASIVQNNILERLHVSIMLEWGAAGNVIAYNSGTGNFHRVPSVAEGDIDMHGAHPQFNLFEGNVVVQYGPDGTWGSSANNSFFRNWAKGTSLICSPAMSPTPRQTIICSPTGYYTQKGVNSWYGFQAARPVELEYPQTSANMVGNVVGSLELTTLRDNQGQTLPFVDKVWALCGGEITKNCGTGSRSYSGAVYGYNFGYGNSSDTGDGLSDSLAPWTTLVLHGDYSYLTDSVTWGQVPQGYTPANPSRQLPPSFYLASRPTWWGDMTWPAMGPDVANGPDARGHVYPIPAVFCANNLPRDPNGLLEFSADKCASLVNQQGQKPLPPPDVGVVVF